MTSFPYYHGARDREGVQRPSEPVEIEAAPRQGIDSPDRYIAGEGLEAAVNTALLLGMPLVVTGKPGCGKTQLGFAAAHALGFPCFKFNTKSTSQAKDVFYTFDIVGRFHASQIEKSDADASDPRRFIAYQALGIALLLARPSAEVAHFLPVARPGSDDPSILKTLAAGERQRVEAAWQTRGLRSVVVVDEVDKAPRDFPNDLLNEIEQMSFSVGELGSMGPTETPRPPDDRRPFVIFTSNSEKQLPDAFLRRCVYFHIDDPGPARLREIIFARLGPDRFSGANATLADDYTVEGDEKLAREAVVLFVALRDGHSITLRKPPGVSELLGWLQSLVGMGADRGKSLAAQRDLVERSMATLIKTYEDRETVRAQLATLLREAAN
jgi:MoxR-like ATPase